MFCTNCGKEINNQAVICPHCGVPTQNCNLTQVYTRQNNDKNGIAIAGFVCSFFIPLLGWIFGGIGLSRANKRNGKFKGFAISAIIISTCRFFINIIVNLY